MLHAKTSSVRTDVVNTPVVFREGDVSDHHGSQNLKSIHNQHSHCEEKHPMTLCREVAPCASFRQNVEDTEDRFGELDRHDVAESYSRHHAPLEDMPRFSIDDTDPCSGVGLDVRCPAIPEQALSGDPRAALLPQYRCLFRVYVTT
eukprot:2381440-Rhodomonas_salina.1